MRSEGWELVDEWLSWKGGIGEMAGREGQIPNE